MTAAANVPMHRCGQAVAKLACLASRRTNKLNHVRTCARFYFLSLSFCWPQVPRVKAHAYINTLAPQAGEDASEYLGVSGTVDGVAAPEESMTF